jgi:hypothetical protein
MTMTATPAKNNMTEIDWHEVAKGTEIIVEGVKGRFAFQYIRNNEITVFGGSPNPNGIRMLRTFDASRCRVARRRKNTTMMQPSPACPPPKRRRRR